MIWKQQQRKIFGIGDSELSCVFMEMMFSSFLKQVIPVISQESHYGTIKLVWEMYRIIVMTIPSSSLMISLYVGKHFCCYLYSRISKHEKLAHQKQPNFEQLQIDWKISSRSNRTFPYTKSFEFFVVIWGFTKYIQRNL